MNWIDGVLIALILAMTIVGSKKGLIRELMAFAVFFLAIIFSIRFIDEFAIKVNEQLGGSALVSAILSFVILLAIAYAAFKIIGIAFYKIANLKTTGKRDQMGGALVGFLRGWLAVSFLTFLSFLLPLPDVYYDQFEASFLGPTLLRTIPLVYDSTAPLHPKKPEFLPQIEQILLASPTGEASEDRAATHRAMYQIDRFLNPVN